MKKILVCLLMLVSFVRCEKAPVHDSLEQHWLLERYTILDTQELVECDRLYFSITNAITIVSEKQGTHEYGEYVARTSYTSDGMLVLSDFKVGGYLADSGEKATPEQLKPFGIDNPEKTVFKILKSSHKHLLLENEYARLELSKF